VNLDWQTIVAIIGALAWVPWLFDLVRPAKLSGKLISHYENGGEFNDRVGLLHLVKLALCTSNKSVQIRDIAIRIKYVDENQPRTAKWYWARFSHWTWPSPENAQKKLIISPECFLGFRISLLKDEPIVTYLTFFSERPGLAGFEWFELSLIGFNGKARKVRFSASEIDSEQMLFDDSIWADSSA
jgi:hypothetical protein